MSGNSSDVAQVVKLLFRQSLGGPATGLAFGICALILAKISPPDTNSVSTILLVAAYGSYFVSEDIFKASGILAAVALGMMLTVTSPKFLSVSLKNSAEVVW